MRKFLQEFKAFAVKGNVIDLAVGVIIGSSFTAIVNSLVQDVLTPLLSLLTKGLDFTTLSLSGRTRPSWPTATSSPPCSTSCWWA